MVGIIEPSWQLKKWHYCVITQCPMVEMFVKSYVIDSRELYTVTSHSDSRRVFQMLEESWNLESRVAVKFLKRNRGRSGVALFLYF